MDTIREEVGNDRFQNGHFELAARLFDELIREDDFTEFLTLKAQQYID
jgi:malate synthase